MLDEATSAKYGRTQVDCTHLWVFTTSFLAQRLPEIAQCCHSMELGFRQPHCRQYFAAKLLAFPTGIESTRLEPECKNAADQATEAADINSENTKWGCSILLTPLSSSMFMNDRSSSIALQTSCILTRLHMYYT